MPRLQKKSSIFGELRKLGGAAALLLIAACPDPNQPCTSSGDCRAEELCVEGRCRLVCNRDRDCRGDEVCVQGVCMPGQAGSDAAAADSSSADTTGPDALPTPDATLQDTAVDGTLPADATTGDATAVEAALPDAALPDAAFPDAATPDAAIPDAAPPDTAPADAALGDVGDIPCSDHGQCTALDGECVTGACNLQTHRCYADPKAPGADCNDGVSCTDNDKCFASGVCAGTPNDANCPGVGEICHPTCFSTSAGCGVPPATLGMRCDSPITVDVVSTCDLVLPGGLDGQTDCLSCSARVGYTQLELAGFEDASGTCTHDGWQLIAGDSCTNSATGCNLGTADVPCCSDFASICDCRYSGCRLASIEGVNCGGGFEEWRLYKDFDTTGLHDLRICYDVGEAYATAVDAVIAIASDGASHSMQLSCPPGDINWRGGMQTVCADLPDWAENNDDLTLTFVAHSDISDHEMRLDNILLYGWRSDCASWQQQTRLTEDFGGCSNPITDGWNGWTVTGAPACGGGGCSS